jgi:hypothetical protein
MCVCTWYGDVQGKSQGLLLFPVSVCDENEFQRSESMMNDMNGVIAHRCSILPQRMTTSGDGRADDCLAANNHTHE